MINFSDRLKKLKERRQGTAQRYALDQGYTALSAAYDYRPQESYEKVKDSDAIKVFELISKTHAGYTASNYGKRTHHYPLLKSLLINCSWS